MPASTEPRAAQLSVEDQGAIMALLDIPRDAIKFEELNEAVAQTQEVLLRVAQYSQAIQNGQMLCDHPHQIIDLQWQITDLWKMQFLLLQCDYTEMEQRIQIPMNELDEATRRPAAAGTRKELREELEEMTRDARHSAEKVRGLRMQLANALTLAAWGAPAAPQAVEGRG
jgi:hypothetical protein